MQTRQRHLLYASEASDHEVSGCVNRLSQTLPQAEEIVMLSSLAREAAELLWEMVANEDVGDATQQMRDNATAIQVPTRMRNRSFLSACFL